VYFTPFEFKCSVCGRAPTAYGWSLCALCSQLFCSDHLVVKKGVATCESCATERERRQASSGVSAADEDRVVSLLRTDVEATVGRGHDETIAEAAARRRLYVGDPAGYVDEVVDDVQQHIHDTFVDTTWPACPYHPNHPLWFSDGWWRCERIEEPIARLGALSDLSQERQG
jgi:hypothetical protein